MAFLIFRNAIIDVLKLHSVDRHAFIKTIESCVGHALFEVPAEGYVRIEFPAPFCCLWCALSCLQVLVFKSMLSVKIPGGEIYEYLPAALRNFMILNF